MPNVTSMAEKVFREHVSAGPFQSGKVNRRWRLLDITWPNAFIAVTAAKRDNAPLEYVFRFDCSDYPATGPTAQPWDWERQSPLSHNKWPGGSDEVQRAFNPNWNDQALYLPCDRLALPGHDSWRTQHPGMIWSRDKDITFYLRFIYDLLHSSTYSGVRGT